MWFVQMPVVLDSMALLRAGYANSAKSKCKTNTGFADDMQDASESGFGVIGFFDEFFGNDVVGRIKSICEEWQV